MKKLKLKSRVHCQLRSREVFDSTATVVRRTTQTSTLAGPILQPLALPTSVSRKRSARRFSLKRHLDQFITSNNRFSLVFNGEVVAWDPNQERVLTLGSLMNAVRSQMARLSTEPVYDTAKRTTSKLIRILSGTESRQHRREHPYRYPALCRPSCVRLSHIR